MNLNHGEAPRTATLSLERAPIPKTRQPGALSGLAHPPASATTHPMTVRAAQRQVVTERLAGEWMPPERLLAEAVRIATEPEVRHFMALWMEVIAADRAAA